MPYALIDNQTGAFLSGPMDKAPKPAAGQIVVPVPGSFLYGLTTWSPDARGFIDNPVAGQRIYMTMAPAQNGRLQLNLSLTPPPTIDPTVIVFSSRGRLPDNWPISLTLVSDPTADPALRGPTGADGKSAYQLARDGGYGGTVAQWLATLVGADGKSAYQIARDAGYGGTQTQWLASLVGASGVNGSNGTNGKDGAQGAKGDPGATALGTITIGETIPLAVGAGVRRVTITTPTAWGVAAGQNLQAFATALPNGSYALHDVIATGANTISVAVSTPALAVLATYSISARLVRIG